MAELNPYRLIIVPTDMQIAEIDLDQPSWATTFAEYMRKPGFWYLIDQATRASVLGLSIIEGEQPYYVARHVGKAGSGGSNEVTIYGIGKKRLDGHVDRLWVLPGGTVCGGDDESAFGMAIVEAMGPRIVEEEK